MFFFLPTTCITLKDTLTGELLARYPIEKGASFSVEFVHSVNNTPLKDIYKINGDKIYVTDTIYYGFGAGVQTDIGKGQTLSYTNDGAMKISGYSEPMPEINYIVGTVFEHVLEFGNKTINLSETFGVNRNISFTAGRWYSGLV